MIKTVVITGGPCAGKTSVASHIDRALGSDVLIVPDVAKHLQQVFPRPEMQRDTGSKLAVMRHLRTAAAQVQGELESAYLAVARKLEVRLIICDGGLLDSAAYWPEGVGNFLSALNVHKEELCAGYRAIIHLQSLAASQPRLYDELSRQHRRPPLSEAQLADQIIRRVWSSHDNYEFVTTNVTEDQLQQKVTERIRALLAEEKASETTNGE